MMVCIRKARRFQWFDSTVKYLLLSEKQNIVKNNKGGKYEVN